MAAFAFAALWILLSPKLPNIVKCALAVGMFWVAEYIENNFAQAGALEDRQSSDRVSPIVWWHSHQALHPLE